MHRYVKVICQRYRSMHAILTPLLKKPYFDFRRQRPEELPASFELGVHIQGRRKNRRSEARQLPPGARPATATAVGVSGAPPNKLGPKTSKISVDFLQRPSLIANISGKARDIQNLKANVSRSIPPAFYEKRPVYFGSLIIEILM